MSTFEKLIGQRKLLKITQREMAKHLKCTPTSLNRYENGSRNISATDQDTYADKLGIELKMMLK